MKTRFASSVVWAAVLMLLAAYLPVKAQSNFVLHTFGPSKLKGGITGVNTNGDGITPNGWLVGSGSSLYGSAKKGGTNGSGTLFSLQTNGTFSLLYTFPFDDIVGGTGNTTGANPNGGLAVFSNLLYGTTSAGGTNDLGVIFSISTNGTGIQVLHTFTSFINTNYLGYWTNKDGVNPSAGLVASGRKVFGTATFGGFGGNGVAFSCSNTTYSVIHHFTAGNINTNVNPPDGVFTNSDGANPACQLVLSGTNLFGTTYKGGTNGYGTIFRVSTNGSNFAVLYHFDTNGANPNAGLVLSGGKLFGISGSIIYSLSTNGTGFTILQQFDDIVDSNPTFATSGLTVTNGTLYGVAASGVGSFPLHGQVLSLNTNGSGFTDFHQFTPLPFFSPKTNYDGAFPSGGLVLLNSVLYGAASQGGTNASGVLFQALPPPPILSSQLSGSNFLLGFDTLGGMGYTVQQNTNLAGTAWIALTNFIGDSTARQFAVPATNAAQMFFRVRQP
jgi:uncharacterized repeat protein (TIGR03803 family)